MVAGRQWLRSRRAVMDFGNDTVKLHGAVELSKPSHELQQGLLGACCSPVETGNQKQAFAAVASIPGQGAQGPSDGMAEVCCCDELRFGYNLHVYCTSSAVSEKQLEEAVLEGWLSVRREIEEPVQREKLTEAKTGNHLTRTHR